MTVNFRTLSAAALMAGAASLAAPVVVEAKPVRGTTATSINRSAKSVQGRQTVASGNRSGNVVAGNTVNRNVNRGDVNINRDINIDVDDHWDPWDRDYHPVAAGVAFGAAAAVTAAVIGSTVRTLPPACATVYRAGIAYYQCGSAWYQPQYVGTQVTYVVVNAPG